MSDSNLPPQNTQPAHPSQPYAGAAQPAPAAPLSAADEKLWASLAHFGGLLGPLPALLIFLLLKDRSARVRQDSKEGLNFQITIAIALLALWIVSIVLSVVFWPLAAIVGILQFAVWIVSVVFSIIGGLRVQQGGAYRYPFALRLVK